MTTTKPKPAIYIRTVAGNRENDGILESLELQKTEVLNLCKEKGYVIPESRIYSDTGSASIARDRLGFSKLIQDIQAGEIDTLIAYKIDRLSRNPIDEGTLRYFLQKGILKMILTTDRQFMPNDNSLIWSVEFGVANQYIRTLKDERKGSCCCCEHNCHEQY